MTLIKLRLAMIGTLGLIIGISTLLFAAILSFIGLLNIVTLFVLVAGFNIVQWLIAPYLIDLMYGVRELSPSEAPRLHRMVEQLSKKSGIKKPKIVLANIPIPNAFAYGSPIAGTRVAVTQGLLKVLEEEEVEAVVGHELGHLKHKDVQLMMFASLLPAIFYYLGYTLIWSGAYSRERNSSAAVILGAVSLFVYFILNLMVLGLSRLREYYADRHSAEIVEDGPRKLSEALAKLYAHSRMTIRRMPETKSLQGFKALFIVDPDVSAEGFEGLSDAELVRYVASKKLTIVDKIMEILSTHPNIVKRIRALQALGRV